MGQRFTISESEKNRIKGLYEQAPPLPGPPKTGKGDMTGDLAGQTVNFYADPQNKKFVVSATIKSIRKGSYGVAINFVETDSKIYFFKCDADHIVEIGGPNKYFSTSFIAELKKRFCGKSSGGTSVPKANYTQTSSAPSDMV